MNKHQSSATNTTETLAQRQPATSTEELLDVIMQRLSQELVAKSEQGEDICDNFDIVDRLLHYENLKQRRLNARTRELKAQAKAAEYAQKTQKPAPAPQEVPKPPVAAPTPTTPPPRDRSKPFVLNPIEGGPMPNFEIVPMPS